MKLRVMSYNLQSGLGRDGVWDWRRSAAEIARIAPDVAALQEVAVNRSMIAQCSGPIIVVADSSKIGTNQSFVDYGLEMITHLITDSGADPKELELIRQKGVEVITV